jgi:hypothetical protein
VKAKHPGPANRMTVVARERVKAQLAAECDDANPAYLFSTTHTTLLLAIEDGLIDAAHLARSEVANRGLDADGVWCGFPKAREIHLGDQHADATSDDATAEQTVAEIARRILHFDTLDSRNSDALDFFECAVWTIREALLQAHAAGVATAARTAGER